MYYPIHPEGLPVELALACIISSIDVANRLLCSQVSAYLYVSRLTVRDYVPNPNAVDELMDKIGPTLKTVSDTLSHGMRTVVQTTQEKVRSARR